MPRNSQLMLISAYIASYTNKTEDIRLFSQVNQRRPTNVRREKTPSKIAEQFQAPKAFEADRMFAIFESISGIVPDHNMEMQIEFQTLIKEGFLIRITHDIQNPKLKSNVSAKFAQQLANTQKIDLSHYLS
jgi:hypothetical protein